MANRTRGKKTRGPSKRGHNITFREGTRSVRDQLIVDLAVHGGYYGSVIAQLITSYTRISTGVSTVFNILGQNNISLRKIRQAKTKRSRNRALRIIAMTYRGSHPALRGVRALNVARGRRVRAA